jgi:hypothetical protein
MSAPRGCGKDDRGSRQSPVTHRAHAEWKSLADDQVRLPGEVRVALEVWVR